MRRSRVIDIPLVAQVAATAMLLGCGSDHRVEAQRCVDADWTVVHDDQCAEPGANLPGGAPARGSYGWYYGGTGTRIGDRADGGGTVPPTSGTVVRPNSGGVRTLVGGGVSTRGGFGAHASGATVGD